MNSRFKRVDDNQSEIVTALRAVGASVQSIAAIGKGCPDILVGFRRVNYLFEIKCKDCPPSKQKLTEDEITWQEGWCGQCYIVNSANGALKVIGAI